MFAFVRVPLTYDMLDKRFWFPVVCWWVDRNHEARGLEARRVCSLLWGAGAWGSGWWPQKVLHGSVRCIRHHVLICAGSVLQPSWLKVRFLCWSISKNRFWLLRSIDFRKSCPSWSVSCWYIVCICCLIALGKGISQTLHSVIDHTNEFYSSRSDFSCKLEHSIRCDSILVVS